MCYTGKCPYEFGGGESAGECRLTGHDYPDDAYCIAIEREIEEERRRHPVETFIQDAKWKLERLKWNLNGKSEIPF